MSTVLQQLGSIQAIGWTLLHSLWLGVLLWVMHVVVQSMLRRWDSRVRYAAACACMLLLVASLILAWLLASVVPTHAQPAFWQEEVQPLQLSAGNKPLYNYPEVPQSIPWLRWLAAIEPVLPYVVALWAAGILLHVAWTARAVATLHQRANRAALVRSQPVIDAFSQLCGLLLPGRVVMLRQIDFVDIPATFGWLRPVVLLPFWVVAQMSADEVRCILAHELAHIRRRDYLINLVQEFVETALFFHPLVRRISSDIRQLREECCDDQAIEAIGGDRRAYAKALVSFEKLREAIEEARKSQARQATLNDGSLPHAVPSLELSGGSLDDRIHRLVQLQRRAARRGYAHLVGALLAIALCTSMAMGYGRARLEEQELNAYAETHTSAEAAYRLLDADVDNPKFVDAVVNAVQIMEGGRRLTRAEMDELVAITSRGASPMAMLKASSGQFGAASQELPIPGSPWKGGGQQRWGRVAEALYKEAETMPPGVDRARFVRAAVLIVTHAQFGLGPLKSRVIPFRPNFAELSALPPLTIHRLQTIVARDRSQTDAAVQIFLEWREDNTRPPLPDALRSFVTMSPGMAWQLENWRHRADKDDPRVAEVTALLKTLPYEFGKETRRVAIGLWVMIPPGEEGAPAPNVPAPVTPAPIPP